MKQKQFARLQDKAEQETIILISSLSFATYYAEGLGVSHLGSLSVIICEMEHYRPAQMSIVRFKCAWPSGLPVSSLASTVQSQDQNSGPPLFCLMLFPPTAQASRMMSQKRLMHLDVFTLLILSDLLSSILLAFCRILSDTLVHFQGCRLPRHCTCLVL